jgi:hypothetical protein
MVPPQFRREPTGPPVRLITKSGGISSALQPSQLRSWQVQPDRRPLAKKVRFGSKAHLARACPLLAKDAQTAHKTQPHTPPQKMRKDEPVYVRRPTFRLLHQTSTSQPLTNCFATFSASSVADGCITGQLDNSTAQRDFTIQRSGSADHTIPAHHRGWHRSRPACANGFFGCTS